MITRCNQCIRLALLHKVLKPYYGEESSRCKDASVRDKLPRVSCTLLIVVSFQQDTPTLKKLFLKQRGAIGCPMMHDDL